MTFRIRDMRTINSEFFASRELFPIGVELTTEMIEISSQIAIWIVIAICYCMMIYGNYIIKDSFE